MFVLFNTKGEARMKKRIILELAIYVIIPVILNNILGNAYIYYAIGLSLFGGVVYTCVNKVHKRKYNLSGIIILLLLVAQMSLKLFSITQFDLIVKELYFLFILCFILLISSMFKKSFIIKVFKDTLEVLEYKKYNIDNIFNRNGFDLYFNSFNALIIIHLLIISFIKIHFILMFKEQGVAQAQSLSSIVNLIFISVEIILSILNINRITMLLNFTINTSYKDCRVVYFNKYKDTKKAN